MSLRDSGIIWERYGLDSYASVSSKLIPVIYYASGFGSPVKMGDS